MKRVRTSIDLPVAVGDVSVETDLSKSTLNNAMLIQVTAGAAAFTATYEVQASVNGIHWKVFPGALVDSLVSGATAPTNITAPGLFVFYLLACKVRFRCTAFTGGTGMKAWLQYSDDTALAE